MYSCCRRLIIIQRLSPHPLVFRYTRAGSRVYIIIIGPAATHICIYYDKKKGLFPRRPVVNTKLRLKAVIIIIPFGVDIHIYNILRTLYRCVRFHTCRILYRIPKL